MKRIEILGDPDIYLLRSWILPVGFAVVLVVDFIASKKLNFSFAYLFLAFSLIVISNRRGFTGANRKSKYLLEFGKTDLVCKFKDSVFWHVSFSKISHAVEEEISSGTIFLPKRKQFLIYTKEGDSYSIPIKMPASQIVEIKAEIERVVNAGKALQH